MFMTEERTAIALLLANGAAETAHKFTVSDALAVSQIIVGIATALWFFAKWKGQRIDNERQERKDRHDRTDRKERNDRNDHRDRVIRRQRNDQNDQNDREDRNKK